MTMTKNGIFAIPSHNIVSSTIILSVLACVTLWVSGAVSFWLGIPVALAIESLIILYWCVRGRANPLGLLHWVPFGRYRIFWTTTKQRLLLLSGLRLVSLPGHSASWQSFDLPDDLEVISEQISDYKERDAPQGTRIRFTVGPDWGKVVDLLIANQCINSDNRIDEQKLLEILMSEYKSSRNIFGFEVNNVYSR